MRSLSARTKSSANPGSILPRIFETIFLLLNLDDLALERRFEDWRVKTGRVLVNIQCYLSMVEPDE